MRDGRLEPGPFAEGNWSSASGEAGFAALLAADPDLDAIFAANDQMALGVLHAASARGIRVPEEIAVVGFDGLPEVAQFVPALTTVSQPLRELGITAVRQVLAQVNGDPGARGRTITLPTQLVIRDSAPALATRPAATTGPTGAPVPA